MRKTESASDACGNGMVDVALANRLQARSRGVVGVNGSTSESTKLLKPPNGVLGLEVPRK